MLTFTGCDMFRKLAGRPTGSEIEQMRMELVALEAEYKARIDSLEREKKILADSLAALDSIRNRGTKLIGDMAFINDLPARYYIIIGSFKELANAQLLYDKAKADSLEPVVVKFRNGYNAVAVLPTNRLGQAYENLLNIVNYPFCPEDVWILFNN